MQPLHAPDVDEGVVIAEDDEILLDAAQVLDDVLRRMGHEMPLRERLAGAEVTGKGAAHRRLNGGDGVLEKVKVAVAVLGRQRAVGQWVVVQRSGDGPGRRVVQFAVARESETGNIVEVAAAPVVASDNLTKGRHAVTQHDGVDERRVELFGAQCRVMAAEQRQGIRVVGLRRFEHALGAVGLDYLRARTDDVRLETAQRPLQVGFDFHIQNLDLVIGHRRAQDFQRQRFDPGEMFQPHSQVAAGRVDE